MSRVFAGERTFHPVFRPVEVLVPCVRYDERRGAMVARRFGLAFSFFAFLFPSHHAAQGLLRSIRRDSARAR
jgi:hypothetical protein